VDSLSENSLPGSKAWNFLLALLHLAVQSLTIRGWAPTTERQVDMKRDVNRREFIHGVSVAAAGFWLAPSGLWATAAPSAPVAVAKCATYGPEVVTTLAGMFDQLGGLHRLVNGKTVSVKLNLTGSPTIRLGDLPQGQTYWVHPQVVGALAHLLGNAGARRIRLLESSGAPPLAEYLSQAGWKTSDLTSAASRVELVNTNYPGAAQKYARLWVPGGGLMFKGYDVNPAYEECDVFFSLAKIKEHATTGVTLSMKNSFGLPPVTIYGLGAGIDEPAKVPSGHRAMLHAGDRQPSKSAPSEIDPSSPRDGGYRVPRIVADLVAARPIHLAVIDGIETVAGGEGPWYKNVHPLRPGLLIAGANCVNTDAVSTALMGLDPMADRGAAPFEKCDSTLKLAEQLGIGTRDLSRIEVRGLPIQKARVYFRST
jgi:uncharacterized protein (DUF362 family)